MEETNELRSTEPEKFGKTFWLVLLALIGLGLSIKLCIIYYLMNFVTGAEPSFCAINETVDCDAVAKTQFSFFFGVPLSLYGVCLYLFVIFMCFVDKLQKVKYLGILKVFKNKYAYIMSLYLVSFAVSMILTYLQFKVIHKFCVLCFATYLVDFISIFVAKDYKKPIFYEVKTSFVDFWEAVKNWRNLVALMAVMLVMSGVLYYTDSSSVLTPQLLNYYYKMKGNPYNVHGNNLGNPDGDVIIYIHSDFECPMCKVMDRMLQRAAGEFGNIYVIHYNYPLDMECNPFVTRPFHNGSCRLAKFAIAAKNQDKYWDMVNVLFDKQPKSNAEVYKYAQKAGIDINALANDYLKDETQKELQYEIAVGLQKKIDSTPTIYINGNQHTGARSYEEFRELLIKYGAKPSDNK